MASAKKVVIVLGTNKFTRNLQLSNKEIKDKRAAMIGEDASIAQTEIIQEIVARKRKLDRRLLNLEDMSPESTMSLNPGRADFIAANWAKEVQFTKCELKMVNIELEVALETNDEYFAITE
jgi:hypothetical protein